MLGASAASIDFQSIDQSYNHLELVAYLRSDYNGFSFDTVGIRFNADSGSNHYTWGLFSGGQAQGLGTSMQLAQCACDGAGHAGDWSQFNWRINRYAATVGGYKLISGVGYHLRTDDGSSAFIEMTGGAWLTSGTGVNEITLFPINGSNWVSGSAVYLYGIT